MAHNLIKTENYLLVVDDSEIKVGDWIRWDNKITKAIDTTYLPTTKKIIAHLPLNHLPVLKGVPLLPPCSDSPTEFECEMYNTEELKSVETDWIKIGRPKTITTAQGIQWVGKYK